MVSRLKHDHDPNESVVHGHDIVNQLTSVTDWNANAVAYAYDDANRMTTKTLPSGTGIVSATRTTTPIA